MAYVYEHWRTDTMQPFYVGKAKYEKRTCDFKNRTKWHKAVQAKVTNGGGDVIVRLAAQGVTGALATSIEKSRIRFWRLQGIPLVNLTDGGEGAEGRIVTDEARENMRRAAVRRNADPEYRKRTGAGISASWDRPGRREAASEWARERFAGMRGPHSEETKRKISAANTGKPGTPKTEEQKAATSARFKGVRLSDEHKEKISRAKTGVPAPESTRVKARERELETRRLQQYAHLGPKSRQRAVLCVDDGMVFDSVRLASSFYGINYTTIHELCSGLRGRKTAGGKVFKFAEVK